MATKIWAYMTSATRYSGSSVSLQGLAVILRATHCLVNLLGAIQYAAICWRSLVLHHYLIA
jgi:hypothetical protein